MGDDGFFHDEGLKVLQRSGNDWDHREMDAVWEHPLTKAKVFIGGIAAAQNAHLLRSHSVSCIVNCQGEGTPHPLEGSAGFNFLRMPINAARSIPSEDTNALWEFYEQFLSFVDEGTSRGESVLIHCLAGAHRAPTATGVFLLWKTRLPVEQVTSHMKKCRSIVQVDPFLGLVSILKRAKQTFETLE